MLDHHLLGGKMSKMCIGLQTNKPKVARPLFFQRSLTQCEEISCGSWSLLLLFLRINPCNVASVCRSDALMFFFL